MPYFCAYIFVILLLDVLSGGKILDLSQFTSICINNNKKTNMKHILVLNEIHYVTWHNSYVTHPLTTKTTSFQEQETKLLLVVPLVLAHLVSCFHACFFSFRAFVSLILGAHLGAHPLPIGSFRLA